MSIDRDHLEKQALEAVSADDYYDLLDCVGETDDETLMKIIEEAEDQSSVPSVG